MQVTVRDLMTSQPLTIGEQVTVEEATRKTLDLAVSELYVVDENNRLQGTVSDFALLKARLASSDPQEPVARIMSRSMLLLNPGMRLEEVVGFFRESCYPRLAVVEGGRLVGQLARRDVLRALVVLEEISLNADSDESRPCLSTVREESTSVDSAKVRRLEACETIVPPQPSGLRSLHTSGSSASVDTMAVR